VIAIGSCSEAAFGRLLAKKIINGRIKLFVNDYWNLMEEAR
jgi:hypothetical protein